jgi:hypothetical protein
MRHCLRTERRCSSLLRRERRFGSQALSLHVDQSQLSSPLLLQISRAPARVPRADHSGVKLQGRSGMSVCRRRVCSSSHTPIEHWSSFAPRSAWVRAGDHSLARLSSTPQG